MRAEQAFAKAGCQIKVAFDAEHVLVQEYHDLPSPIMIGDLQVPDVLVFLFCRKVAVGNWKRQMFGTKELFHPVVIGLTPQQKAELVMAGRWPAKVVN